MAAVPEKAGCLDDIPMRKGEDKAHVVLTLPRLQEGTASVQTQHRSDCGRPDHSKRFKGAKRSAIKQAPEHLEASLTTAAVTAEGDRDSCASCLQS